MDDKRDREFWLTAMLALFRLPSRKRSTAMEKPDGICDGDYYDFLETGWMLSDNQLLRAIDFLQDIQKRRQGSRNMAEMASFFSARVCPKGHHDLIAYGHTESGTPRFWCKTCKKAYTEDKLTVFYSTKLSQIEWETAYQLIAGKVSLSRIAETINVNINTAWYLRQRIMAALEGIQDKVMLSGNVWIDELYKSDRRTDEKKKRGISSQQIPVFVCVDSFHHVLYLQASDNGHPTIDDVKRIILPHISDNVSTITTDSSTCYNVFDGSKKYNHVAVKADPKNPEYVAAMAPLNNICSSLRSELDRHNGIAKAYLQRYLNLFWLQYTYEREGINAEKLPRELMKLIRPGSIPQRRRNLWTGLKDPQRGNHPVVKAKKRGQWQK